MATEKTVRIPLKQLEDIVPFETLDEIFAHDLASVEEEIPRYVFLDMDGVLSTTKSLRQYSKNFHENFKDGDVYDGRLTVCTQSLNRFKDFLGETGAKVVLSSSWRLSEPGFAEASGLGFEIVDSTCSFRHGFRGMEVEHFLMTHHRRKLVQFVIIDDESDFFDHQRKFHVHTDEDYGFTRQAKYRAKYILENMSYLVP